MPKGRRSTRQPRSVRGFTIFEVLIYLAVVVTLLAVLLPTLNRARMASHRDICANHQRQLAGAWMYHMAEYGRLPYVPTQPEWRWGGAGFSSVNGSPILDMNRPLNRCMSFDHHYGTGPLVFRCPADHGITDESGRIGTGRRSAFRSFGSSYRANSALLGGDPTIEDHAERRGLPIGDITTPLSRLVLMGDAVWFEAYEQTGRDANWHGEANAGNLLFMDGSVKFQTIRPKTITGPAVFDPFAPTLRADQPVKALRHEAPPEGD